MKKVILFIFCIFPMINAQDTKTVQITGALVAPWVKGNVCISYWYEQNKIHICYDIHAAQDYIFSNIPKRVDHIKVRRSFAKECSTNARGKKSCRTLKGRFNTPNMTNIINLTYDHSNILKYYSIPPKQPESIYGYPRRDPSILFTDAAMSDPTAFS